MRPFIFASVLLTTTAVAAPAQGRWKDIGKTSSGNSVYVDPRSVKTANGITTARIRVKFNPPVQTPKGVWATSQHLAMFDCAKSSIAVKENVYYADERTNKVVERKVNAQPGYGPALKGSLSQVALDYFCLKSK
jgi:hypothetical protein